MRTGRMPPVTLRAVSRVRAVAGALAVPPLLALAGCASDGTNGVETPTTAYVVAEIEQQIAAGESLNAMQRIWALESESSAQVGAEELAGLRSAALSSMRWSWRGRTSATWRRRHWCSPWQQPLPSPLPSRPPVAAKPAAGRCPRCTGARCST